LCPASRRGSGLVQLPYSLPCPPGGGKEKGEKEGEGGNRAQCLLSLPSKKKGKGHPGTPADRLAETEPQVKGGEKRERGRSARGDTAQPILQLSPWKKRKKKRKKSADVTSSPGQKKREKGTQPTSHFRHFSASRWIHGLQVRGSGEEGEKERKCRIPSKKKRAQTSNVIGVPAREKKKKKKRGKGKGPPGWRPPR